jgi:pyruvate,water dikinase
MDVLSGIPTSIGHHTGPVKVVRGIQDFEKVSSGDVLVIPYSDVGWTPLFARAGAVVAESGGLLSHSSIVAREYNIPAVVSVEGATLLPDETLVTVDGHKGEILIHK